ncbi:MAG: carboxypeptidase-like regulatory domain-containing protein, partial [Alicyclobacillus sp.]|nr:carboxypeptidase-like regulatory domain-containing protein [Alicyclobacillus sp.]
VSGLPKVIAEGTLRVNGADDPTAMVAYRGNWYVPLSALMATAGMAAGVDNRGNVHILQLSGGGVAGTGISQPVPGAAGSAPQSALGTSGPAAALSTQAIAPANGEGDHESSGPAADDAVSGGVGAVQSPLANASSGTSLPGLPGGGLLVNVQFPSGSDVSGAKLAFLRPDGEVYVAAAAAGAGSGTNRGQAQAPAPAGGATLIGWFSPRLGWIGEAVSVTAANRSIRLAAQPEPGTIAGIVRSSSGGLAFASVDLRSSLTHAHYLVKSDGQGRFQAPLPVGAYEVWTVSANGQTLFVGQSVVVAANRTTRVQVTVPKSPGNGLYVAQHCIVAAQSADVQPLQLVSVARMFERIYPYDLAVTGLQPDLPVVIQVYARQGEYVQHFLDEAYPRSDAEDMAMYSQAVSEGIQSVSLNLDGLTHEFAVDVLAHEFLHCLVGTVSQSLPDWVNEGLAWYVGIGAEVGESPDDLVRSALQWDQWADVVRHAARGDLYPLTSGDPLAARYNVEAQDYFAVNLLIQRYGLANVMRYIRRVDAAGDAAAFQSVFGQSESAFSKQVSTQLQRLAGGSDRGVRVTLRVLPGGPEQLFVSNPKGTTYWFGGVKPGLYTFVCRADGSVQTPAGLTAGPRTSSPVDGMWDIGAQVGRTQGFFSVDHAFGLAYLQSASMFYGSSDVPDMQIASALPMGVQVVSVEPVS